jgi:hypothetical protein
MNKFLAFRIHDAVQDIRNSKAPPAAGFPPSQSP